MRAIETDRSLVLAVPPDRLWAVLEEVPAYPSFWPWLRRFDGRALERGEQWTGVVAVAGPYRLALRIALMRVQPGMRVVAAVTGAIWGAATITTTPHPDGTHVRLTARLAPRPFTVLALATRLAPPLAQASHDRVITRALTQLRTHVEAG